MMEGKGTIVILLLSALLSLGHGLNWIGAGNWTVDNLTTLWTRINSFDSQAQQDPIGFVKTFSDDLSRDWSPAINVVLVAYLDGQNYDSVLYGYGFNGHWFWANGMSSNQYFSFIIWKDYNCLKWRTFDWLGSSQIFSTYSDDLTQTIRDKFTAGASGRDLTDIWKVAEDVQATVPTADASLFQDKLAYSVVASPLANVAVFFKVCAKEYAFLSKIGLNSNGLQ